ncbi:hypothetical protein GS421_06555 [Rhodococcus hoagii]|nr:hypothetical protein [Prescottella equi]
MTARPPTSTELEAALAQRIADSGLARYQATGAYPASEIPASSSAPCPTSRTPRSSSTSTTTTATATHTRRSTSVQFRVPVQHGQPPDAEQLGNRVFRRPRRPRQRTLQQVSGGLIRVLHCHRHLRAPAAPTATAAGPALTPTPS